MTPPNDELEPLDTIGSPFGLGQHAFRRIFLCNCSPELAEILGKLGNRLERLIGRDEEELAEDGEQQYIRKLRAILADLQFIHSFFGGYVKGYLEISHDVEGIEEEEMTARETAFIVETILPSMELLIRTIAQRIRFLREEPPMKFPWQEESRR